MTNPYAKRGALLRVTYLILAFLAFVWLRALRYNRGVIVICYHAVTPAQRTRFEWQMRQVARWGPMPTQSLRELPRDAVASGVCVTFDDAFDCLRDSAFPALRALKIPATVFAVSGNLGAPPRWDMPSDHPEALLPTMDALTIRALRDDPFVRFGSHSVSHPRLALLDWARLDSELRDSRTALEGLLERPVVELALPHGSINADVHDAALRAGYRTVFTLEPQPVFGLLDRGLVGRFSVSPDQWHIEFLLTLAGAYAWLGPWRRLVRSVAHWLRPPRRFEFRNHTMVES